MTCKCSLKTWPRFRMFDYKKKFSRNENRKGFAISKLRTLYTGGKIVW